MSQDSLTAKPVTLAELFSTQRRYEVPRFQRDYAWEDEQWEDLFTDVFKLAESDSAESGHFLGPIVLQDTGERHVQRVIDGQQRLITITLLALAIIHRVEQLVEQKVEPEANAERAQLMRAQIVSTRETASLRERPRMRLNDEDDGFYNTRLVQKQASTLTVRDARRPSERRLLGALLHFRDRIDKLYPAGAPGATLAERFERILNGVQFIEIRVTDDNTAFIVFETLNARGVALNTADLAKNYLFALAAEGGPGDLAQMQAEWRRTTTPVGPERVSQLLFHALAAGATGDLAERRVFAEIKRVAPDRAKAFELMVRLEEAAQLYAALESPEHERWSDAPDARAAREAVRLLQALEAEQVRTLLLAAAPVLSLDELAALLQRLPVLLLRAQIARVNTGDLKRAFQRVARELHNGQHKRATQVLRSLREVYPTDEAFRSAMEQLAIAPSSRRKRLLRHILARLEADLGGRPVPEEDPAVTVEHILPERQPGAWEGVKRAEEWVNRLGNLTLLELSKNKQLRGSTDWAEKQAVYADSAHAMARAVKLGERWTPEAIRLRQSELAERAVRLWHLELDDPPPAAPRRSAD
jgi:hypothetical protein